MEKAGRRLIRVLKRRLAVIAGTQNRARFLGPLVCKNIGMALKRRPEKRAHFLVTRNANKTKRQRTGKNGHATQNKQLTLAKWERPEQQ